MDELTGYELSRDFFNWSFENPEKITPTHVALYFFIIEHNNRMGWKEKFGLPTTMAKEAIGIRNYKTYANTLNDLIEWKFINMIEKSKNQYSANIVALVKNTNAHTKALTKASLKHLPKQVQSIDSINKPNNTETNKPNNTEQAKNNFPPPTKQDVVMFFYNSGYSEDLGRKFYQYFDASNWIDKNNSKITNWKQKAISWFEDKYKIQNKNQILR